MKIIIGLGNPGEKYKDTWHNIGFMAIDEYARENNFPDFKLSKKFEALVSQKADVFLLKPQTFMNRSGKSVRLAMNFYKTSARDVVIIHDEADVLAGKIKISEGRGSAGHKGIESIFNDTGNQDFIRIRIGIGLESVKKEAKDIVLEEIGSHHSLAKKGIKKSIEAIEVILKKGIEKAMNEFNQ